MDAESVSQYILYSFAGVDVVVADGNSFFFYNPDPSTPPDRRFPFTTLVTSDLYDQFSNLDRPSVFRLNIGVSRATFESLFGSRNTETEAPAYDFTALDRLMPHPVYGQMHWVCVLNSDSTFEKVKVLLAEAYDRAVTTYEHRQRPRQS